jgi:hypothetical protein
MAKNDKVLLDGIIDDRIELKLPSTQRDEVFEYLAFEQILKDFDLSRDEIESGSVDGRNDGGIDGFFIFVNGICLDEPESFSWPRSGSELEVWIITCKHHDTFLQAPLDNLVASLTELLDFGLSDSELKGDYSELVLKNRENLKSAYRKLSPRMAKFSLNFAYASRGDASEIGESVVSRSKQIKSIAEGSFSTCETSFTFFGSTELVELHRKVPNFSLDLPFVEVLSRGERYVLLVQLEEYYRFVSDDGKLRRYLFDSNVRDYMGLNSVNEDIKDTLDNDKSSDFWWLNNGITILATKACVIGKSIQLQDIQIVNGLQTTQSIFNYFSSGESDPNKRLVLIKIIVSKDETVRDSIIRATNNQTNVEMASLHATEKIQRDIEEILLSNGLFYERRKNYYINLGHLPSEIITPLYLASGYVNLILKSPHKAASLKSRFMRSEESYDIVFSKKTPITVWPKIAILLKKTDEFLEKNRPTGSSANERFLKNWRQITCLLALSKIFGTFDFSVNDVIGFDMSKLSKSELESTWEFIYSFDSKGLSNSNWKRKDFVLRLCQAFTDKYNITGVQRIEKSHGFPGNVPYIRNKSVKVDMEFAMKVNSILPPQPWKPRIHHEVTKKLGCTNREYFDAVKLLIDEGLRYYQKDGVVYDPEGNVLCFDPERVNSETLELKSSKKA